MEHQAVVEFVGPWTGPRFALDFSPFMDESERRPPPSGQGPRLNKVIRGDAAG